MHASIQVLQQDAEFDALQWFESVRQHYAAERSSIKKAAEQAAWANAERTSIGQWLSGLVLGEGKVRAADRNESLLALRACMSAWLVNSGQPGRS